MRTSLFCAGLVAGAFSLAPAAQAQIDFSLTWERLGDSQGVLGQERGIASIESAEFSHDGTRIVSGAKRGGDVILWTAGGQELWRRYHANRAEVEVVAFTRDDRHAVSGGEDGFIRVWRVSDGAEVQAFTLGGSGIDISFDGMRFSPDGTRLATGDERGQLTLWDTSDPNPASWPTTPIVTVVQGNDQDRPGGGSGDADINSIDWSADGQYLFTAGRDETVKRWRVSQLAPPQGGLVRTYVGFNNQQADSRGFSQSIKSNRLSPDGQLIAAGGQRSPDGRVIVWRVSDGAVVASIPFPGNKKIEAVEWTPDGRYLLAGGNEGRPGDADIFGNPYPNQSGFGPIRAFDRENGFALAGEQVTYRQEYFDFDADGDRLVTSSEDGGVRLWSVSYGTPPSAQAPFGGTPAAIPGRLEAERFDAGGPGVAYEDADTANQGGAPFRAGEAVDVYASPSASGGHGVGWIDDGEYLEFTVDVAQSGLYAVSARVATPQTGRDFRVEAGGASAAVAVPNTGGWTAWQTAQGGNLSLAAGEQVVRLALADGPFNLDWVAFALTDAPATPVTTEARVSSSNGDAEQELGSGAVQLGSVDLDMASAGTPQVAGMRFALDVPPGAVVTAAYVQFTAKEGSSGGASLSVRAQAADNASAFSSASGDLTGRPRTSAAVAWSPGAWTLNAAGAAQRTPDLAALVQAVVDRSGWQAGNHLALLVDGSGKRSAWSYDGKASAAPLLVVTYEAPGGARASSASQRADVQAFEVSGVFPNPSSGRAAVRYTLPEAAAVAVRVYDVLGREVARRDEGPMAAGRHEAALDVAALPAGLYVVRIRAGEASAVARFTVAR